MKSAVSELKKQNIDKIVAIGHAGIEMDKKIAKEVNGVDIVVGGHSNTFLYTGIVPQIPALFYSHPCSYPSPSYPYIL